MQGSGKKGKAAAKTSSVSFLEEAVQEFAITAGRADCASPMNNTDRQMILAHLCSKLHALRQ